MIKVSSLIQNHFRGNIPARRMSTTAAMSVRTEWLEPTSFNHSEEYEVAIKFYVRYIVHRDNLNEIEFANAKKSEQERATKELSHAIYGKIVYKLVGILNEARYQSKEMDDPLVEAIQELLEEVEETMK
jgi:hypothetical protein